LKRRNISLDSRQREILGLVLLALGVLTLLSLLNITPGIVSGWWAGFLRQLFGWGAYPVALALGAGGVILLAHNLQPGSIIGWRMVIGLELVFLAGLALVHLLSPSLDPLQLAHDGGGGGYVGWAISELLSQLLGWVMAFLILMATAIVGLILTLDLSLSQMRRALTSAWKAGLVFYRRLRPPAVTKPQKPRPATPKKAREPSPPPVISQARRASESKKRTPAKAKVKRDSRLPPLDILNSLSPQSFSDTDARYKARVIEETLVSFGVPAKVVEIKQGPVVTQFGVEPGYIERRDRDGRVKRRKVRVSRIQALVNDLALALAAAPIRIEAPVPGQPIVGIEVPNSTVSLVSLREVVESQGFQRLKSKLKIALGADVSGQPIMADLGLMPHLLIAGATGSGKSVCINSIVTCLLFHNTPETLRLLMIDPKMVELVGFNGVPHLLAPVVVELEEIVTSLTWVTRQMDERYRLFAEIGARHIDDYNRKVARQGQEILPYIVVVIDELADVMMVSPDTVERSVCRIAQMARATGIHLVIATQRPSVDVVTGLIKANFPARISFAVTSQVDSRVVLDTSGAERLLGRGDMLFMAPDSSKLVRLQGCFVSDKEMEKLVDFWKETSWAQVPAEEGPRYPWYGLAVEDEQDELLEEAIEVVKRHQRASTSFLQRRLRIGYPRAARLMDMLEEEGIVGPPESGGRWREVLIGDFEDTEEFEEYVESEQ
jgi:S-DNA-T family DNA segregation ATPase FtsK/SpoIIIE